MIPTGTPNFYITEENYYQLTGPGFWEINEIPRERWDQIGQPFSLDKTVAVFASGCAPHKIDAPPGTTIGGVDWLRLESNPKPAEPPLNVNHFIIGSSGAGGFPVYGPFISGCIIDHWSDGSDIDKYYPLPKITS